MTLYLADPDLTLYQGDALTVLQGLPDESVHMAVTSPPFFGLRDYGVDGQIGLESSPAEWCARLVEVFREVRRVLRSDGVMFLECGDSYVSSALPGGASRGMADRAQGDCPVHGSAYLDRDGESEDAPSSRSRRSGQLPPEGASPDDATDRGSGSQDSRSRFVADSESHDAPASSKRAAAPSLPPASHDEVGDAAPTDQISRRSSGGDAAAFARSSACTCGTAGRRLPSVDRRSDTGSSGWASTHSIASPSLKPKDQLLAPHLLAAALRDDGWVLRQTIVWSKSNPMPESVTDRCTTAHSYVFMFSRPRRIAPPPSRFELIPESDKRWLAALIDTEGCIVIKRVKREGGIDHYGAQVSVTNQSLALLETARALLGGVGNINVKDGTNAPVHYWQVSNKEARDLLLAVYRHLIVKPRQARIAIYAEELLVQTGSLKRRPKTSGLLERLWATNKACNQREHPDLSWVPEPRFGRWTSQPYFYDAEAIKEPLMESTLERSYTAAKSLAAAPKNENDEMARKAGGWSIPSSRNARSVWTIPTEPSGLAVCANPDCPGYWERDSPREHCGLPVVQHYAAFPQALVEKAILAGTSEKGCCPECDAPWRRIVEKGEPANGYTPGLTPDFQTRRFASATPAFTRETTTPGWEPSCRCVCTRDGIPDQPRSPQPAVVLDCFSGSGTSLLVARRLGRHAIGIELSEPYARMTSCRLSQLSLLTETA